MTEAALHAVIAGAGPSGLCAALALAQAGWRVSVIEQAPVMDDLGAGLQISPNASRLLHRLGVLDHLRPLASEPQALRIRRGKDAAVLATLPLGAQALARWGAPFLVVHRADLQRALLECVARVPLISLKTGTRIMGFANHPGSIEIGAKMGLIGLKLSADLLIGADGLRSLVRERLALLPNDQPLYSGRIAWRALVPYERVPYFARAPETNLWLGRKTHLVHYPVRKGALINLVAITQDHWRAQDEPDLWSSIGEAQDVQARFNRWHADPKALIASAEDWRRWPLYDRAPLPHWHAQRVVLAGDAAHPMLPFLAQGSAQGIEDGYALGLAAQRNGSDLAGLIQDYESQRMIRARKVQQHSRQQGWIYHLPLPFSLFRDLTLKALGPERLQHRVDWLYGHDPD